MSKTDELRIANLEASLKQSFDNNERLKARITELETAALDTIEALEEYSPTADSPMANDLKAVLGLPPWVDPKEAGHATG